MRKTKGHKFPVTKYMSHEYEVYRIENTVNNNVITLYGDREQLDLSW